MAVELFMSYDEDLDWLILIGYGRVENAQPSDRWRRIGETFGFICDAPGGAEVGFKILDFSAFSEEDPEVEEIWDGPRFDVPVLGLTEATAGEIVLAARPFLDGHSTVNRLYFNAAMGAEGEEAERLWRYCLQAGDLMAHYALGYTLFELGRYREAYRHLRAYTELVPADGWAWSWLGKATEAMGDVEEAEQTYERAIALDGDETDAPELLVFMLMQKPPTSAGQQPRTTRGGGPGLRFVGQPPKMTKGTELVTECDVRGGTFVVFEVREDDLTVVREPGPETGEFAYFVHTGSDATSLTFIRTNLRHLQTQIEYRASLEDLDEDDGDALDDNASNHETKEGENTVARTRTSETHPLGVDFIHLDRLPGRLGLTIAPGTKDPGARSGGWDRDLAVDIERLRRHHGADVLVTLLEEQEFRTYAIPDLLSSARAAGMDVVHFPIRDVSVPNDAETEAYRDLIVDIIQHLENDETVIVHCRGGIGRTGVVTASVLSVYPSDDVDVKDVIERVRETRSQRCLETKAQEAYVQDFQENWIMSGWDRLISRANPPRPPDPTPPTSKRTERRDLFPRTGPTISVHDRYRGAMLGMAAGDALGTTVEFKPLGSFTPLTDIVGGGPFKLRAGEWTDDTTMALCLAASLVECGTLDLSDQLHRYVRWYRDGYMSPTGTCFDIGGATRSALKRFERTGNPRSGATDPNSAGNGSIMRLAPAALFFAPRAVYPYPIGGPEAAIEGCGESSLTTHGAPACVDACRYFGALIMGAIHGASKEELLSSRYAPSSASYWNHRPLVPEIDAIAKGSFKEKTPPEIKGKGYVVLSLEAALWAFHTTETFEEGALAAVNLGDDADTTGAVYGQLAGAYYGVEAIPSSWRRVLSNRLLLEYLADGLYRMSGMRD